MAKSRRWPVRRTWRSKKLLLKVRIPLFPGLFFFPASVWYVRNRTEIESDCPSYGPVFYLIDVDFLNLE